MSTYVVGDIHGCYDEWLKLKEQIENYDKQAKFTLIGDIVDRGPKVMEMIDWAIKNVTPSGKYQMVLGNHEDMLIEWAKQYYHVNKTDYTKSQLYKDFEDTNYDFKQRLIDYDVTDDYVLKIIDFFKSLPLYIDLEAETFGKKQYYVICHAALPDVCLDKNGKVIKDSINDNVKDYIVWERKYYGNNWEYPTIIVHGHTPTCLRELIVRKSDPGKIDFRQKDINIDCGMCYGMSMSNLAAIRLEDLREFYVLDTQETIFTLRSKSQANKNELIQYIKNK